MAKFLVATSIALLLLSGCTPASRRLPGYLGDPKVQGSVVRVEQVGSYPATAYRGLLWFAKVPVAVSDGAVLYRVTYWSRTNGEPVLVSGLMGVPGRDAPKGTVLWMHGTNLDRKDSVSKPNFRDGVLLSGVFAGGGYLYLAPDLLGLGVSRAPQAYLYNPSTIEVTLDFLRAAEQVSQGLGLHWNPNIYVAGFSQGGHSAAVIARALEERNDPSWRLRAGAGIEGAYDLANVSIPFAMTGATSAHSLYLTNLAQSYATYYHHPLDNLLNSASAKRARALFDGDHDGQIGGALPANPRDLFTREFLEAYDQKKPTWFMEAARANEAYLWAPKAPFRAYYGDRDVDVSPNDAKAFSDRARRLGGNVSAVAVGPFDHFQSAFHAVPMVRRWIDSVSTN